MNKKVKFCVPREYDYLLYLMNISKFKAYQNIKSFHYFQNYMKNLMFSSKNKSKNKLMYVFVSEIEKYFNSEELRHHIRIYKPKRELYFADQVI
jgi:hypothetical protein